MPEPDYLAFLLLLAESLATSLAEGGDSVLVHVSRSPTAPTPAWCPSTARRRLSLLGTVAPPECSALGVALGAAPARCRDTAVVAGRGGRAGAPRGGDRRPPRHGGEVIMEPPAYGLTVDCLQRALGLPTAPPQVPAVHLVATALLEAGAYADDPGRALALLDAGTDWSPLRWEGLRQLVAAGRWPDPTLAPDGAAWFDESGFSRWVLTGRPTLPALLRRVTDEAGVAEASRCAGVLREMGIEVPQRRRRRAG